MRRRNHGVEGVHGEQKMTSVCTMAHSRPRARVKAYKKGHGKRLTQFQTNAALKEGRKLFLQQVVSRCSWGARGAYFSVDAVACARGGGGWIALKTQYTTEISRLRHLPVTSRAASPLSTVYFGVARMVTRKNVWGHFNLLKNIALLWVGDGWARMAYITAKAKKKSKHRETPKLDRGFPTRLAPYF